MKDTNKLKEFVKRVEDRTNEALEDSLMDDDAKEENFNVDYNDIVKNSKKAKLSKLPWLISIFLILSIVIMFCLSFFSNNPKTVFTQTVDGLFDYLKNNVNENVYDVTDGNITLDYNIKGNDEIYAELSKLKFSADYIKDNASNRSYFDLDVDYDGNDFIVTNIYEDGEASYVYVPNIADKYIKLRDNKLSYFVNGNEVKIILDGLNQAIDKVVSDEKIFGSNENIEVNGKTLKSYMTRLTVDKNNRKRVAETFINTLKSNDEFTQIVAKMKGVSNSDIKKSLDNYLDKLKKKLTESEKVNVSLYVDKKTKEFIKVVFESEIGTLNLISNGENNYSYNIVNKDKMVIEGNFSLESNDNKTKYVYHLYCKKTLNNNVLMEGNFNLKYTAKKADAVLDIDVSDSLDLNTMSDLDKLSIYGKILADPNLSKFLPIIRKLI